VLKVLYHHAKFGVARISPTAGAAKTLSFLSVSLFVRHAYVNAAAAPHAARQVVPVVLREFYYLFPLKIVVRYSTQSHTNCYLVK